MKKALVYNPYWDTLGGGERYTATFVELLLQSNWQVDIIWQGSLSSAIRDRFGLDISSARYLPSFSALTTIGYDLSFYVSDGSLPLSFSRKNIVHFQFPFTHISGHSWLNRIKSSRLIFIANSRFTKSFIDPEFDVSSQVIYPPVQTQAFPSHKKTSTILYVGRFSHLTQAKNPHLLIEAFRKFHALQPSWRLVLAGGAGVGTAAHDLARLTSLSSGLPVEIVTNPDLNKLKKLFGESTLFWSASGLGIDEHTDPLKAEHFGITPVEAMSAGCIPLLTNLGGHKEIVSHGTDGILYQDLDDLVSSSLKIITHPQLMHKMSQAALQKSKIFDIEVFKNHFRQII